jgi:hypothetical protein
MSRSVFVPSVHSTPAQHTPVPASDAVRVVTRTGLLQRACACGGATHAHGECAECRRKRELHRQQAAPYPTGTGAPQAVLEELRRPGQPLDGRTRAAMQAHLGHDFSQVRIHSGERAAASARSVSALAYTVGRDVVFGDGRYSPDTDAGRTLLAHELVHTAQQGAGAATTDALTVADASSAAEQEATAAASRITATDRTIARAPADAGTPSSDAGTAAPTTADAGTAPSATDAGTVPDAGTAADAGSTCALTTYTGSNFVGDTVTADVEFVDSLTAINQHAVDNDVQVHVTDSFRAAGTTVSGAIVTPATNSNHLAGHAIDMNVKYGATKTDWCNSTCLGGTLPEGVSGFIDAIKGDTGLRWGGDFSTADPVHIDDNLNSDNAAWKARYDATQAAHNSGCA